MIDKKYDSVIVQEKIKPVLNRIDKYNNDSGYNELNIEIIDEIDDNRNFPESMMYLNK